MSSSTEEEDGFRSKSNSEMERRSSDEPFDGDMVMLETEEIFDENSAVIPGFDGLSGMVSSLWMRMWAREQPQGRCSFCKGFSAVDGESARGWGW